MASVSLPMYDLPEIRAATDDWWRGLARAFAKVGIDQVPAELERPRSLAEHWHRPDLLFSQTCGYPLIADLAGVVRPVATPVFDAPGCSGPTYRSAIITHGSDPATAVADLRGRICAVNGRGSHSGYNTLRHSLAGLAKGAPFFSQVVETGSHLGSLEAVASGQADVAATDCVTFALLSRYLPAAVSEIKVIAWSAPAPGLPFVTRVDAGEALVARLRDGLQEALADPNLAETRQALLLVGAENLALDAYDRIHEMEQEALEQGYPSIT